MTPDKNLFHCFGCGIGGGPIDWVMKKNGVSFRHAVEVLREGLGSCRRCGIRAAGGCGRRVAGAGDRNRAERARDRRDVRRPALSRARPLQEHQLRSDAGEHAGRQRRGRACRYVDLYAAKSRQLFAKGAASELECEESVVQRDFGRLLLKLEELQDAAIEAALKPTKPSAAEIAKGDEDAALALKAPNLLECIVEDFDRTGLVGEPTNALVGYLTAISRKLTTPLAIIVQSTSAAGKSALMDAVLRFVSDEDRVHYSAMTGQSLFYLNEKDLKHKILAIAEKEGVRQAAYALKLLQSQGELTITSTGKDPDTGLLVRQEYHVEGPVMLFLTTTAIAIDEELLNR